MMEKKLERMISECEEIKDHGLKYDDGSGKYVTVIFVGGGYYKILCESLGHQGASCYFPCIYCQVRMNQLAEYESSEPRTLRTISEHSHRSHTDMKFPYTCACCNKVYATPAALNTSHTDANDNQLRIFKQTHKSMKPHVAPLFSWIAPKDRIIDLLHLLLRVVEALWAERGAVRDGRRQRKQPHQQRQQPGAVVGDSSASVVVVVGGGGTGRAGLEPRGEPRASRRL